MRTVLIIEDELMIADILEELLTEKGFHVCGISGSVTGALLLAEQHKPHLAVVDVLLTDGYGTVVAPVLIQRYGTGILYTTANRDLLDGAIGHASLSKPFRGYLLAPALEAVASYALTGIMPSLDDELAGALTLFPPIARFSSVV